ncbi:hypothetical protein BAPKO_0549 [Borreliella afzelii PKo]|nr:hypothetical protein BAPKO_0549 [Borreliella afzelii PKo]
MEEKEFVFDKFSHFLLFNGVYEIENKKM